MAKLHRIVTPGAALKRALEVIFAHAALIPGLRPDHAERAARLLGQDDEARGDAGTVYLDWERAWRVGCSLSLGFKRQGWDPEVEREHGEVRAARLYALEVEVNWPSTHRTPVAALSAAKLYAQVAELAALLQATFEEEVVGVLLDQDEMMGRGYVPETEDFKARRAAEKLATQQAAECRRLCRGKTPHKKACPVGGTLTQAAAPAPEVA